MTPGFEIKVTPLSVTGSFNQGELNVSITSSVKGGEISEEIYWFGDGPLPYGEISPQYQRSVRICREVYRLISQL